MHIGLQSVERLTFGDRTPVRAASGLAPLGDGFLVVQDDSTHAAWMVGMSTRAVRLFPAVDGHESFDEASGTKHLKPDVESACEVQLDGGPAVLVLGSGSSPRRMRSAVLRLKDGALDGVPEVTVAELEPLYSSVADALGVPLDLLNLEGACMVGDVVRWFQRGLPSAGAPAASVDLPMTDLVEAASGRRNPASLVPGEVRVYDLGSIGGVGLAVTDAVALADGAILVSAAAEDSPNPRDDGPVVGSALVRLMDRTVTHIAPLPLVDGHVCKVEGLVLTGEQEAAGFGVLAVADVDDPTSPSLALRLVVRL